MHVIVQLMFFTYNGPKDLISFIDQTWQELTSEKNGGGEREGGEGDPRGQWKLNMNASKLIAISKPIGRF